MANVGLSLSQTPSQAPPRPVNQRANLPPASPQQIWLGIWWVSPSSVPLSQADCFVSASVSRTKTFGRCRTPPRLLVPTPTLTDELDPGLSLPLFGAVSCLMDFDGVWCRKYSTRLQPARLGLRRGLRFLRYLLGDAGEVGRRLDGRWMTDRRSRKEIGRPNTRGWTVRNPAAFHPPRPPGTPRGSIRLEGTKV